jgi:hypothetical protein
MNGRFQKTTFSLRQIKPQKISKTTLKNGKNLQKTNKNPQKTCFIPLDEC